MTNPYAPPAFDDGGFVPPGGGMPGAPQPWEVGEVYKLAWEIIKRQPILIVVVFGVYMVQNVPGIVLNILQGFQVFPPGSTEMMVIVLLVWLAMTVIGLFLYVGLVRTFVAAARGQPVNFSVLLSGADQMLPMIVLFILWMLSIYVGALALCIGAVVAALAFMLAPFYLVDARQGIVESMKTSWRVTRGNRLKLFLFLLVGVLLSIVGICAACMGYFVAWAVVNAGLAVIYLKSTGEPIAVGAPPPVTGGPVPGYAPQGMG